MYEGAGALGYAIAGEDGESILQTVNGVANLGFSIYGGYGLTKIGSLGNAGQGYKSFDSLKASVGSPGKGNHWHHIVEQSQINKSGFTSSQINNTKNIIAVDGVTHVKLSGYYSSIQDFSQGMRVRDWLAGQSFAKQSKFGIDTLKMFGVLP